MSKSAIISFLSALALTTMVLTSLTMADPGRTAEAGGYVGAKACEPCHEEQHKSFYANSSKSHSWQSVAKMLPKLTAREKEECYACHTTGYGKQGGFVSFQATPELANLSCEVCHGPGAAHSESGDPAEIVRKPDVQSCKECHNPERVHDFKFKPMLYHGGH